MRHILNILLLTNNPDRWIRLLIKTKLNRFFIPELDDLVGLVQNKYHHLDAFEHTMMVLRNTPKNLIIRLSALLHDIGKPQTKTNENGEVHFYKHDEYSQVLSVTILHRLGYSDFFIEVVSHLIGEHMRLKEAGLFGEKITNKSLRKLKNDLGEYLNFLLKLVHADNISHTPEHCLPYQVAGIEKRLSELQEEKEKIVLPLNGNDIKEIFNIESGKMVGLYKNELEKEFLKNPTLSKTDAILYLKQLNF